MQTAFNVNKKTRSMLSFANLSFTLSLSRISHNGTEKEN